jgi:hypothetical protein
VHNKKRRNHSSMDQKTQQHFDRDMSTLSKSNETLCVKLTKLFLLLSLSSHFS